MVQAADPRNSDLLPELPRLDLALDRCVVVAAHVRAVVVVIAGGLADQVQEMTLTEHDHVIKELSTKRAHPPFRVPVVSRKLSPRLMLPRGCNSGAVRRGATGIQPRRASRCRCSAVASA